MTDQPSIAGPSHKPAQIDIDALRDALSCFATGVAVVTTLGTGRAPIGLTVNSFNSVSLSPPLILWSLSLAAPSLSAFRSHPAFAVNILSEGQRDICERFAVSSADKFAGLEFRDGIDGVPLLKGTAAHLECRTYRRYPGGDHEIYLGHVVGLSASNKEPLVLHRGQFAGLLFS